MIKYSHGINIRSKIFFMLESFLKFYVRIVRTATDMMNISHVYSSVDTDEKARQRLYSYQFIIEKGFWFLGKCFKVFQ